MRAAITLLEEEGFVSRRHGSGTYVTHRPALPQRPRPQLRRLLDDRFDRARAGHRGGEPRRRARACRGRRGARRARRATPSSVLRRVRTAGDRRVVDVTDWCRIDHLAPDDLAEVGSIYAALAERGLAVDHGVAHLTPWNADGEVARRLDVPSGTLLLTIDQVDRTADGVAVLVSREHHLADAFTFTLVRRGPGPRGTAERARSSSGSTSARRAPARRRSSRTARWSPRPTRRMRCPIRARAGPSRTRRSGRRRSSRRCREVRAGDRRAARSRRCRSAPSSTASSPPAQDGEPLRPALIWCDRRAGAECEAAAERIDPERAARADRLQPRPRAHRAEDRLAGARTSRTRTPRARCSRRPARGWRGR